MGIVERLRNLAKLIDFKIGSNLANEAADLIERLREVLETIVNNCGQCGGYGTYPEEEITTGKVLWSDCSSPQCQEARAALKEIDNGDR